MGRKRGLPPGRQDDGTSSTSTGPKSQKKPPADNSGIGTFGIGVSNQGHQNDVQPSSSKTNKKGDAGVEVKTGSPQSAPILESSTGEEMQAVVDDLVGTPWGPGSDIVRKKTLDNSSGPGEKAPVAHEKDEHGDQTEKLTEIEDCKKNALQEKEEEIERLRKELNESRNVIAKFRGQDLSGENKSGQNNADNEKPLLEFQGGQEQWKAETGKMRRSNMAKKLNVEENTLNQKEGSSKTAQKNGGEAGGNQESGRNSPCSSESKLETTSGVAAAATVTRMKPLENPLILNHLFKFCGARVLANCRLVCKQWYQESLQGFRAKVVIRIKPDRVDTDGNQESYALETNNEHSLPLQEFLAYVADPQNQCSSRPYRSITMVYCKFFGKSDKLRALWSPLLGIGVKLTTLILFRCTFNGVEELRKIIFEACPNLQNLEVFFPRLTTTPRPTFLTGDGEWVYMEPLYGRHDHLKNFQLTNPSEFTFLWLELFSHFQSMTNFYVRFATGFGDNMHDIKLLLGAIRAVRKHDPMALPLKCVEIRPPPDLLYCYPEAQQQDMGNMERVPLESLRIEIGTGTNKTYLKNALDLSSESVKWIELSGTASVRGQAFPFGVQLDELKNLEIGEKAFESMSFLKYTPNLQRLKIAGNNSDLIKIVSNSYGLGMEDGKIVHPHLKTLELYYVVSDEDLASLIEWMPNLTSLTIPLNDKQFGMICEKWRKLTELCVPGKQLSDAGVTGIVDLGMKKMGKKKQVSKDATATRPNITYLQELQDFEFRGDRLSDASVFHGFLKLPRLRRIIYHTGNLRWGSEARRKLGERGVNGMEVHSNGCRTVDFHG